MGSNRPHLAEGPPDLVNSCDIILKLDNGTELPAHAQILARCMPVFCDMLDGGPLSNSSVMNVVSVPFSDCSLEEANCFLSAIYSFRAYEHITTRSALSIARLSHKYGVKVCLSHSGLLMYLHARLLFLSIIAVLNAALRPAGNGWAMRQCPCRDCWHQQ